MEKEINFTQKKNKKKKRRLELLWLFLVTFLLMKRQNVRTCVYFFFFFRSVILTYGRLPLTLKKLQVDSRMDIPILSFMIDKYSGN